MADHAPLGYGEVSIPSGGWNGGWGQVPIQGPVEESCRDCGRTERQHDPKKDRLPWSRVKCWAFHGHQEDLDRDRCQAEAMVITEWTCHACGAENDVWGDGAMESWMECGTCQAHSFLRWAV